MNNTFFVLKNFLIACLLISWLPGSGAQGSSYPTLHSLPAGLDSLPEYEVKDFARQLANQAAEIRYLINKEAERASTERENIEAQLAAVEADTLSSKEEKQLLSKALKAAKKTEKKAQTEAEKVEKVVELAMQVAEQDSSDLRKNLPKAYKKVAALIPKSVEPEEMPIAEVIGTVAVSAPQENENTAIETPPADIPETNHEAGLETETPQQDQKNRQENPSRPAIKSYDRAADVMYNPPALPCILTTDARDAFSGEQHRELQKEELFRFTNPTLKTYYKDREHVVCRAAVSTKGGSIFLQLQFTINDVNAQRTFGNLPRNGVAILKLLDGETHTIYNLRADEGKASEDKSSFLYNGQYQIEPGMLKALQKNLLDKIRIAWSTGYEDYDVQNVDLLTRQLPCLLKK